MALRTGMSKNLIYHTIKWTHRGIVDYLMPSGILSNIDVHVLTSEIGLSRVLGELSRLEVNLFQNLII